MVENNSGAHPLLSFPTGVIIIVALLVTSKAAIHCMGQQLIVENHTPNVGRQVHGGEGYK